MQSPQILAHNNYISANYNLTTMKRYKNKPEGFSELRKQILSKTIPMMALIVLGSLAISYFSHDGFKEGLTVILAYTGLIAVVLIFSTFRSIKQQQAVFNSFELAISDDYLLRKQQGLADKTIFFIDIETITETEKGFLGIKGATTDDSIFLSPYLDGYDEVKNILQGVKPINIQQTKSFLAKYQWVGVLAVCGLMAAVYTSNNKIIVGISGVLLICFLVWGFYKTRTSSLVDQRIKSRAWMIWVVILSMALIVYYKVFGGLQP